jgi:DNA invertase Pin-like site-specific DNA recombinase
MSCFQLLAVHENQAIIRVNSGTILLRRLSSGIRFNAGENTVKCAIYARVSTKDKGQDPLNQVDQLKEYCQRQQWEIAGEYVDYCSGKTPNREQFKLMFEHAYQRKFDCVLFWSLDRFSREGVLETLQHLQKLTSFNVAFKSFTEQYLDGTGMFRDAVISILAAIAKQERVRISERTKAGLERANAKGRFAGRPRIKRERDRHAAQIRQLRDEGQSYSEIADELGRSKSDIARVCQTLGCAAAAPLQGMILQ